MPEQYDISADAREGLDALDGLIRRQNELLRAVRRGLGPSGPGDINTGAAAAPPREPEDTEAFIDSFVDSFEKEIDEKLKRSADPEARPGGSVQAAEPAPESGGPALTAWAEENGRVRRRRRLTGVVFYTFLVAIVLAALGLTGSGAAPRSIFGFSTLSVLSGSMQSEIPKGSLVLVRRVDPDTLKVGDDITYMYTATESITHKIAAIYENYTSDGRRGFQTEGVNNSGPDQDIVPAANVVGKVILHVPGVGTAAMYIKAHLLLISGSLVGFGALLILLYKVLRWMFQPAGDGKAAKKLSSAPSGS